MAIALYNSQNFPNASVSPQYYLIKEVLDSARTFEVVNMLFKPVTMPMNAHGFVGMRRYLTNAVDATPLPEGTNKEPRAPIYEDFSTQMLRYGERYQVSRQVWALTPFDVIESNKKELTKLITLTYERVRWNAIQTVANKIYNSPAVSSIAGVNGPVTSSRLAVVTRSILRAKGEFFDGIETGSSKEGTSPVQACFYAVVHTDARADLDALPGFQQVAYTPTGKPKHITHYGNWKDIAFFTSQEAPILPGQGAASTTMINTAGLTDVYPMVICATNSFTSVSLKGAGKSGFGNFNLDILDDADKFDPFNSWVDIVATWWDAALPTTNDWAWVLYVGCTLNP